MPVEFTAVVRIYYAVALAEEIQHFARGRGAHFALRIFVAGAMMRSAGEFAVFAAIDHPRTPYKGVRYPARFKRIGLRISGPYLALIRFPCNQAYTRGGNTRGFRLCAILQAAADIRV